jgi:hypothetical protein
LIQQGESLAYLRDQMGHASIQITVDTYGHLVPGGNRAAVDRLDDETQPDATPAQPDDVLEGVKLPQVVGGPDGSQLEPSRGLVARTGGSAQRGQLTSLKPSNSRLCRL